MFENITKVRIRFEKIASFNVYSFFFFLLNLNKYVRATIFLTQFTVKYTRVLNKSERRSLTQNRFCKN